MAKSPAEWRREWLAEYRYWDYLRNADWDSAEQRRKEIRGAMSNCVLGYARSRGWYHV